MAVMTAVLVFDVYHYSNPGSFFRVLCACLVAFASTIALSLRSWTKVGPGGITICRGFGSGRTHPWHQIRWIEVQEATSRLDRALAARVFLPNGQQLSLPGLSQNRLYPAPTFDEDVQKLISWWELSTPQVARYRP
jgi:hypothetical protein